MCIPAWEARPSADNSWLSIEVEKPNLGQITQAGLFFWQIVLVKKHSNGQGQHWASVLEGIYGDLGVPAGHSRDLTLISRFIQAKKQVII